MKYVGLIFIFMSSLPANKQNYTRTSGEELRITFDLEPNSCNIYFLPGGNNKIEIVRQGSLVQDSDQSDCTGFTVLRPCGILNKAVHMSCRGHFHVRDHNDNTALVVSLKMERKYVFKIPLITSSLIFSFFCLFFFSISVYSEWI